MTTQHWLGHILAILLLACCNRTETRRTQEFIVFERDTREKDMGFKPTFGRISVNGEHIIKIEFVFVRCGGQGEWEKIAYTNDETKGCWWSVLYNLDRDQIDDLTL